MAIAVTKGLSVTLSRCIKTHKYKAIEVTNKIFACEGNDVSCHLRFYIEKYFVSMHKLVHLGNPICVCVATILECTNSSRKMRRNTQNTYDMWGGGWVRRHPILVPNHPHIATTLANALCNPWTPTRLPPYVQNLNPNHKECHLKATKMVVVSWSGSYYSCHPSKPHYTLHFVTYIQCSTPLPEELPKHHGHKGDLGVTPETCGAIGEMAQMITMWVRALGIGNTSHPHRLRVTRMRPWRRF
jgi:hypothetical protein